MGRRDVSVIASGRQYRMGRTVIEGLIWKKRLWGWRVVARYPLTEEGWRVASAQFAMWEPNAAPPSSAPFSSEVPGGVPQADVGPQVRRRGGGRLPNWLWIVVACVLVCAIAGGLFASKAVRFSTLPSSTTSTTSTSLPAVGSGYLASGTTWVLFVQWADSHGSLSGSVEEITVSGLPPTRKVSSTTIPVSGRIHGSQIRLSFDLGADEFGTLASRGFTVNFPLKSGVLTPVTFHVESVGAYDRAITRLHAAVTRADTLAAEQSKINQDVASVNNDISALAATASSLLTAAKGLDTLLQQGEVSALTTTKAAAQQVTARVSSGTTSTICDYARTVGNYARTVSNYERTFVASAQRVGTGVRSLLSAITGLKATFSALETAQSLLPSYLPADDPTQADVTNAISVARNTAASALSIANGYIGQANSDVRAAYGYAAQAYQTGSCGPAPSPPTPLPQIT